MRYVKAFHTREIGLVDFTCDCDRDLFVAGAFCAVLMWDRMASCLTVGLCNVNVEQDGILSYSRLVQF